MATVRSIEVVADFCAKLRELQLESGIPVATLADRLGISRQHLHDVLGGRVKRPPAWDRIVAPLVHACTGADPVVLASWRRRHELLLEVWGFQYRADGGGPVADFCSDLRELRAQSRIPVKAMAARLNISRQHLYAVLAGQVKRIPDWDTMVRPLVGECTKGDRAAIAQWRRRHELMTAAYEQLGRHPDGVRATGAGVRSSLPPDTAGFTGRDADLQLITAAVTELAQDCGPIVSVRVIGGMPGVGKTAMAIHAAHLLADVFGDRQLFVDLHGHTPGREPVAPLDALALLLAATGADPRFLPTDLESRAAMWRDHMIGQRAIVVLDNAASSAQVTPLLPGSARCLVLVTSRRYLADLPGTVVPVMVEVLPEDEAVRMFTRLAPRACVDDPEAVAELTKQAGWLPLAVSLLARVYARHPSWSLADLAAEAGAQPLTMKAEQTSVAAAFEVSVAHLEPTLQRFFGCLGLHPGASFDASAAAALTGFSVADAGELLSALYNDGLLTETAWRRYGMHDLVRRYARDRVGRSMTSSEQRTAMARLLDYYQHSAARAQALIGTDDQDALAWLRAERASLLACLDYAVARQLPEQVVSLTSGLRELLRRDGPWAEAVTLHERAVRAAAGLADKPGQAGALLNLADAQWLTGDFASVARTAARAFAAFRELGDRLGEAKAGVLLAGTHRVKCDYLAAARLLERALDVFVELGDRPGQAQALLSLGLVRRLTGEYRSAATAAHQALTLSRQLGSQGDQAQALILLGGLHRDTGDYPAAVAAAEHAMCLYRDVSDRNGQARAWQSLGAARRAAGNYPGATTALTRALDIWRELGTRYCRAGALLLLGAVRRETGDYPAARAELGEALRAFLDVGDRGSAAEALTEIGALHLACGNLAAAERCYQEGLDLASQIGSRLDMGIALAGLGRCARDPDPAVRLLTQAHQSLLAIGSAAADTVAGELSTLASSAR